MTSWTLALDLARDNLYSTSGDLRGGRENKFSKESPKLRPELPDHFITWYRGPRFSSPLAISGDKEQQGSYSTNSDSEELMIPVVETKTGTELYS